MAGSCRFAFAVHILAVLALRPEGGVTSDQLAASVNTNPVVIRRILSSLRQAGFVCCAKGAGGGATLCRPPEEITLDSVYRTIERGVSFGPHPQQPNQCCRVGRNIRLVLEEVFSSAQHALEAALAQRTLADVLDTMDEAPLPPDGPPHGFLKSA